MKKRKITKARLPMEGVLALRGKGGAQTSRKGKRGYDRNKEKTLFGKRTLDT